MRAGKALLLRGDRYILCKRHKARKVFDHRDAHRVAMPIFPEILFRDNAVEVGRGKRKIFYAAQYVVLIQHKDGDTIVSGAVYAEIAAYDRAVRQLVAVALRGGMDGGGLYALSLIDHMLDLKFNGGNIP